MSSTNDIVSHSNSTNAVGVFEACGGLGPPMGIRTRPNDCWANSILQQLFNTPSFLHVILTAEPAPPVAPLHAGASIEAQKRHALLCEHKACFRRKLLQFQSMIADATQELATTPSTESNKARPLMSFPYGRVLRSIVFDGAQNDQKDAGEGLTMLLQILDENGLRPTLQFLETSQFFNVTPEFTQQPYLLARNDEMSQDDVDVRAVAHVNNSVTSAVQPSLGMFGQRQSKAVHREPSSDAVTSQNNDTAMEQDEDDVGHVLVPSFVADDELNTARSQKELPTSLTWSPDEPARQQPVMSLSWSPDEPMHQQQKQKQPFHPRQLLRLRQSSPSTQSSSSSTGSDGMTAAVSAGTSWTPRMRVDRFVRNVKKKDVFIERDLEQEIRQLPLSTLEYLVDALRTKADSSILQSVANLHHIGTYRDTSEQLVQQALRLVIAMGQVMRLTSSGNMWCYNTTGWLAATLPGRRLDPKLRHESSEQAWMLFVNDVARLAGLERTNQIKFKDVIDGLFVQHTPDDGLRRCRGPNGLVSEYKREYMRSRFTSIPNGIYISLKRFATDDMTGHRYKVQDALTFEEFIDLQPAQIVPSAYGDHHPEPIKYQLKNFSVHTGSLNSGHYFGFVCHDKIWYSCNDTEVQALSVFAEPAHHRLVMAGLQHGYLYYYERVGIEQPNIQQSRAQWLSRCEAQLKEAEAEEAAFAESVQTSTNSAVQPPSSEPLSQQASTTTPMTGRTRRTQGVFDVQP